MTNAQEIAPWWREQEDVVISGVSCRLPESDNMKEFADHLFNGDDMVTEDSRRWEPGTKSFVIFHNCFIVQNKWSNLGYYDLPKRHGKVKELRKFDAAFFGVHPKQAATMDPQLRILLEVAYEAIVDSGIL